MMIKLISQIFNSITKELESVHSSGANPNNRDLETWLRSKLVQRRYQFFVVVIRIENELYRCVAEKLIKMQYEYIF